MKKYKIYVKGNYLVIVDTQKNEYFYGIRKEVHVDKSNANTPSYKIFNVKDFNKDTVITIPNILKEDGTAYSEAEFDTFYQENTGNFNGGGTVGSATEATQLLIKTEEVAQTAHLASIESATEALDAKTPALVNGKTPITTIDELGQSLQPVKATADVLAQWGNFSNVDTAGGDFVTMTAGVNGQSILALSGSPLTTGESSFVNTNKAVVQPCAYEFALSVVRTNVAFAVASLFANDPVSGAEPLLAPINIISAYQSSAALGAAYNATAGATAHYTLETALPAAGTAGAVYVGDWVNIVGFTDTRLNYPNACINFISPDRKTISISYSSEAVIPSLAIPVVTPTLGTCKLHFYSNMAGAKNSLAVRFSGATSTSAAVLSIFNGDDTQVGGSLLGDQRTNISNTAPWYRLGSSAVYGQPEILATSRYKIECLPAMGSLLDKPEQANAHWIPRDLPRTSVKPAQNAAMYPRFRLYKPVGMTRPVAKIVSSVKTGTTTATVNLDAAPVTPLAVGNTVVLYGMRDTANFPATTGSIVSVISPTQFTIVIGTAVTATSYGGSVSIVNGGQVQQGIIQQAVQSVVSRVAAGSNWLDVIGSSTWAGIAVGDYIDLYGLRNATTGADVGVDGVWEVAHLSTTTMVVKPVFNINGTRISPALGTLASTNCGGTVLLRPTIRLHDQLLTSWGEVRTMIDGQGEMRNDKSLPTYSMGGSVGVTQGSAAGVPGTAGVGAWIVRGAAHRTTDIASAALTAVGQTNSAVIDVQGNIGAHQFYTDITALTGTAVRMFTRLQGSYDNATFFNIYDTTVQTAIANKLAGISPIIPVQVPYIRYVRDLRGTAPSVSNSVTRMTRPGTETKRQRRMNDRVVGLTTTTPSTELLWVEGCTKAQITCTPLTGATTAPTVKLQVCNGDPAIASQWYDVAGATLALSATLTTASAYFDIAMPVQFARLVPTVAGVGVVADTYELTINAWEA